MKEIKYTYKFRLEPTDEQKIMLNKHFGSVRWIFNYFLNQRKQEYLNNKKSINYYDQAAELTQIKQKEETIWLKEINSQTLQYSLKCLDQAYQNFFNKRAQFPNYKSKHNKNSFTVPQNVKIKVNKLIIPKFLEGIKMIMEREVEGLIKHCTISKTSASKYFVSILTEQEYTPVQKTNKSVGIDLGLKDFLVLSNGSKIKNHRFLKHYERKLKLNQQHLSRKKKESKRYLKQKLKVAKIYEKITNSRMDLIHKVTTQLINEFDIIYLENLNIKGMMRNHKLAKSIGDVCLSTFINVLSYKAKWNDKQIVFVGRFFPSTKTCSKCGYINNNLTLKDRTWICPDCGEKHDRDINAAKNILNEGCRINIIDVNSIKNKSVGTTDNGCGDQIRLEKSSTVNETSKKKEDFSS